jgi:hypothetical protein
MKTFLLAMLLTAPAFATWGTPETPKYQFDAVGNVLSVTDCAVDTVAGRVCASIFQDATATPFSQDGTGNLKNQANVTLGLQNALNAARTEILNVQTKKTTDTTNTGKITLPAPTISGT